MTHLLPGCAAPRSPFAPVPSWHPSAVSSRCRDRGRSPFRREGRPANDRRPGRSVDDSPSRRLGPRNRCAAGGTSLTLHGLFVDICLAEKGAQSPPLRRNVFQDRCLVWAVVADGGREELPRLHLGGASRQVGGDEMGRWKALASALSCSRSHTIMGQPGAEVAGAVDAVGVKLIREIGSSSA
jgi:hypothetical protein